MVRYLYALIFALIVAPIGVQAEALPKEVQSSQCEALFSDFSLVDPAVVLENSLDAAIESLQAGQLEQNIKVYFRQPLIRIRYKQSLKEIEKIKQEKIELLKLAKDLHREKMRANEVDQLWINKLTMSMTWIYDLAVTKVARITKDKQQKYFYLWKDLANILRDTRYKHSHALQELQNDGPQSRTVREMNTNRLGFRFQPVMGGLTQKDIVLAILNKVHYLEITLKVSDADGLAAGPLMFTEHDRLHAAIIDSNFSANSETINALDLFSSAFLSGVGGFEFSNPVIEEWVYKFLFYTLHEVPSMFHAMRSDFKNSIKKMPLDTFNAFNDYLRRNHNTNLIKEEADLIYYDLVKILERGGF